MSTDGRQCSTMRSIRATASEAPENPRACWQSRSTENSRAQFTLTTYKQEVRGSSPRPPTNQTKELVGFNDERRGWRKGGMNGQTASAAIELIPS